VHEEDGGRIRYKRVCSVDGEEVPYAEIAKGYETEDGELVILTDEDFADLPLTTNREIEVVEFVPADQVDPILFAKCYYLEPDKASVKPYALLREALTETDRMAVVKVALRQRETLAVLRVRDKVICLQTMLWPDEVRAADFDVLDGDVDLKPAELTMASSLVESLASDFDPGEFTDGYTEALQAVIEAKVSSGEVRQPQVESEDEGKGAEVVDLLTALQRSVEKAKASRGEAPAEAEDASADDEGPAEAASGSRGPGGRTAKKTAKTAKKASATKAPAKRTAAKSATKKAAAKKTAAKKSTSTAKKATAKKTTRKSA
jgi:DNA end-binding protein Ku